MLSSKLTHLFGAAAMLALIALPAAAQDTPDIDFGDDTSNWANDGECDDPRFEGEGMAGSPRREDRGHDATDCRSLLAEGKITFSATQYDPTLTTFQGVDLGDDTGRFPNDGQCDDPRFVGEGMALSADHPDILRDRSDCSYGFQLGDLSLADELPPPLETRYDDVDFGHDKGDYAGDGECDDPRFAGPGMASISLDNNNIGADRQDCLAEYKDGNIRLIERSVIDGFDFGDNRNLYPNDGECDDPRFEGAAMAAKPTLAGLKHDADDCMAAWRADRIAPRSQLEAGGILIRSGVLFGDDSSQFANDGECDDPTFAGRSMASGGGSSEHVGRDRTDCLAGFESGSLKIASPIPVKQTIEVDGVVFGDDASAFANDGECDDSRFEGDGMAASFLDSDKLHDASDCLALFQQGRITLRN
ncbi:MAG: hypothetical protein AAGK23_02005 [Pseudomonadota bacterium]